MTFIETPAARHYAIARHYQGGMREREIAERFGVSRSCVQALARRWGLKPRRKWFDDITCAQIAVAYAEGVPVDEIARRFGCSRTAPLHIARRAGLQCQRKRRRKKAEGVTW